MLIIQNVFLHLTNKREIPHFVRNDISILVAVGGGKQRSAVRSAAFLLPNNNP